MASVASQTRQESMTSSLLRKENVIRLYEAAINRRRFLDVPKFVNSNKAHHLSGLGCRFLNPNLVWDLAFEREETMGGNRYSPTSQALSCFMTLVGLMDRGDVLTVGGTLINSHPTTRKSSIFAHV